MVTMHDLPLKMVITAPGRELVFSDSLLRNIGINGPRIRWGRSRVNEPPKSSSLTISAILSDKDAAAARSEYTFSRVDLYLGDTTIFSGMIDGIEIVRSRTARNPWLVNITAVSATSIWSGPKNSLTESEYIMASGNSTGIEHAISQRWPQFESPLQKGLAGEKLMRESLMFTSQEAHGNWRELWDMYMRLSSMAYPSWNADLTKVWPTLSGDDQIMSTVVLDPKHVQDLDLSIGVDVVDRPRTLSADTGQPPFFTTMTDFGDEQIDVFNRDHIFQDGHDTLVRKGEFTEHMGEWFQATARLLQDQVTAPRRLSVLDTDLSALDAATMERIFCPWETDIQLIMMHDHMSVLTGVTTPALHAIGGDLIITDSHIEHQMTCVWTGANRDSWDNQTARWSDANRSWNG